MGSAARGIWLHNYSRYNKVRLVLVNECVYRRCVTHAKHTLKEAKWTFKGVKAGINTIYDW